jgi:SprB repeat/Putative Ig domain/Bacterial Ig domain
MNQLISKATLSFIVFLSFISLHTFAQTVTATQKDSLAGDHQTIGITNPNDTVRYKTTISANGGNASGVNFSNPIPTYTTQVGTVKTSALCRDDVFATSFNTLLNTGNVLTNDFGLPGVSVVSFGTTVSGGTTTLAGNPGTTDNGGVLTVNANGSFTYQPMSGFFGMDQFVYIGTTGVAGLQNGSGTVIINVAPDLMFTTFDINPTCYGASTGSITFSAMGGTPPYMYSIDGGVNYQMGIAFLNQPAGSYNLSVKDAVNYTVTGTATLTEPQEIIFTHTLVDIVCNGDMTGSITFNASGGTGSLEYSINGVGGPYQMGTAFTGLAANTYHLAVKDANNCVVTGTTTLAQPAAVAFTFTKTDITCNGDGNGSIIFNTTSGGTSPYTYSISGTGGTFTPTTNYTGLSAATYNLVAKDNLGCNSAVQSTTIVEPAAIMVNGTIANLTYNVALSNAPFSKTGGTGSPATPWSQIGLPTGVNINTATGVVSGTPIQTGSFNVTITYTDANGCFDDHAVLFTVAPRLQNESFAVVGNTQLISNGHSSPTTPNTTSATNILSNDQSDAAITVTAVTNAATTAGGSITIGTDGKFTYSPPPGSTAADSYIYTGISNGVSATATITFNITNMVWYVNNTFAGTPDGRSHAPFTTCNAAASASAINQTIYVHTGSGNTTGFITLKSGQTLRGAGNSLTVGALTIPAGTKPTLSGTITLANSVIVDGFDMSTGLGVSALSSNGATSVNVNIANVSTANANNSVTITNTTGSISIAGGSLVGGGGATINISGGSVSFTYGGSINQGTSNHPMVNIQELLHLIQELYPPPMVQDYNLTMLMVPIISTAQIP